MDNRIDQKQFTYRESPPLLPLRIPTNWIVTYNKFYDIDPIMENGQFVNGGHFDEDLLVIERYIPNAAKWPRYVIDLGWRPSSDFKGTYGLTLILENFENILREFESRDRFEIEKKLEEWLEILNIRPSDPDIINLIK